MRLPILLIALLALFSPAISPANAAATSQTTHLWLCAPNPAVGLPGGGRVTNLSSTTSPQTSYILNRQGCALIAGADVSYFLAQGYYSGPNVFAGQATAITGGASGTASETTGLTLPAYAQIRSIVLCETAGNAVTGGLNIGDAGSATRFASAVTLGANACVTVADSALTRIYVPSGVPTSDAILLQAASSWNSASVNITVQWTYF